MGKEKYVIYKEVRNKIKNGDILMYKGKGFVSWTVKVVTRSEYSHAGIAVWWNERLMVMEAIGDGVIISPLSRNVSDYHGEVEWYEYYQPIPEGKQKEMIIFAQQELGKKYDMKGVIGLGVKTLFRIKPDITKKKPNKLFCSQYVANIYSAVGLDLDIKNSDLSTSPDDILISDRTVLKGTLKRELKAIKR